MMRALAACSVFVVTLFQAAELTGAAAIMESLLFGFEMAPATRTAGLPADARRSLGNYRERERLFKPTIKRPDNLDGPEGSEYFKRLGLERALFCLFDTSDSLQLAEEYSTQIRLLYEWEGFADSPLTEAASADAFLAEHRNSSIAPYVRLFAGHRKLCAVSGLEGVNPKSDRAVAIASDADMQLRLARDAGHPLIRIVADYLLKTRKCFER
jgi:hypothetical protein